VGGIWESLEMETGEILECCKQTLWAILVGAQKTRILIKHADRKDSAHEASDGNKEKSWGIGLKPFMTF
jgi:hypothetical protein